MKTSKLLEFKEVESKLLMLGCYRDALLANEDLRLKLEAIWEIECVMLASGVTGADLLDFFGISIERKTNATAKALKKARKPHERRTWVNPHTGERYEAKRIAGPVPGWIEVHGKDEVMRWLA
jgi:hypothetical protein